MRIAALTLFILALNVGSVAGQETPANARKVNWGKGWVCNVAYVERDSRCVHLSAATDAEIRRYLIQESVASYAGSCPCPYNVDRGGRRCGGRSAYSRPGGRSPMCYEADVTDAVVGTTRAKYPPPVAWLEP